VNKTIGKGGLTQFKLNPPRLNPKKIPQTINCLGDFLTNQLPMTIARPVQSHQFSSAKSAAPTKARGYTSSDLSLDWPAEAGSAIAEVPHHSHETMCAIA
jgi:hypothetical protein